MHTTQGFITISGYGPSNKSITIIHCSRSGTLSSGTMSRKEGNNHLLSNHYAYTDNNPSTFLDSTGLVAVTVCASVGLSGNFGPFSVGASASACVVVGVNTDKYEPIQGFSVSVGPNVSVGDSNSPVSGYAGLGMQLSNANSLDDLNGWFGTGDVNLDCGPLGLHCGMNEQAGLNKKILGFGVLGQL